MMLTFAVEPRAGVHWNGPQQSAWLKIAVRKRQGARADELSQAQHRVPLGCHTARPKGSASRARHLRGAAQPTKQHSSYDPTLTHNMCV